MANTMVTLDELSCGTSPCAAEHLSGLCFAVAAVGRPGGSTISSRCRRKQQHPPRTALSMVSGHSIDGSGGGGDPTPGRISRWINKSVVDTTAAALDILYRPRTLPSTPDEQLRLAIRRFWLLETVARVPYFAFLSVLHLRQTFGASSPSLTQRIREHFAEADNEAVHLAVMSSLGGGTLYMDRFIAQHLSLAYYWTSALLYMLAPAGVAYHMNELVELHAFESYDCFVKNKDLVDNLRDLPAPAFATAYYAESALYDFTCAADTKPRIDGSRFCVRPEVSNLYDLFCAIRDDEAAHSRALATYQLDSLR